MRLRKIYDLVLNYETALIKWPSFIIKNKKEVSAIRGNRKFCHLHNGERCFILGNGPSLKTQDLSVLENEYVFTVNQIARHQDFEKLKTNYHFWVDPNFFSIDPDKSEDWELLEIMKGVNTKDNIPICFFPIEQRDFVKKHQLDKTLQVQYFKSMGFMSDACNFEYRYDKYIPNCGTVVQAAIIMAIYMGFSEIYLLGCDTTSLVVTINSALKKNDDSDYAYSISDNEKKRMEALLSKQNLESYTQSYLYCLKCYRFLYSYANKRGIKLINCSSSTVIDSIPRMNIADIVDRKDELI